MGVATAAVVARRYRNFSIQVAIQFISIPLAHLIHPQSFFNFPRLYVSDLWMVTRSMGEVKWKLKRSSKGRLIALIDLYEIAN